MDETLETKPVWVAWTNTNLTDGYGESYPLCVGESPEVCERLGIKGGVQGSRCHVTKESAVKVNGKWLIPGRIILEEKVDTTKRKIREAKEKAIEEAKALGLSEEQIKAIGAQP